MHIFRATEVLLSTSYYSRVSTVMFTLCIFLAVVSSAAVCAELLHVGNDGMAIQVDMDTGAAQVWVDKQPWLEMVGGLPVAGLGDFRLVSSRMTPNQTDHRWGPFVNVTFDWMGGLDDEIIHVETTFSVFREHEMIIFDQFWKNGWAKPVKYDVPSKIVAPFPAVNLTLPRNLNYIVWGGCFLANLHSGRWSELSPETRASLFNGDDRGQPWLLYDHDDSGRSVVMSSLSNFMVSGFSAANTTVHVGLATTLQSIPRQFRHSSILVAGHGINGTLMKWGDVLLTRGGKSRPNVYDDFSLSHLGYWTDNGAYHYTGAHVNYENMQDALLDVKRTMRIAKIPIRYIQWDDWWMESKGDHPGMLSWTPKPQVFPSGFTDWLKIPLALYAPEYSAENVWIHDYRWKTAGKTSIPLDARFYRDLFQNGTDIGMKLFEQDFLCSIGPTGLTNTDVDSGSNWLSWMDEAAMAYNITLQLCMANAYHLLQSTTMHSVTNARAGGDNTRNWNSIYSMGPNGLLFYALGLFASRDNVWTTNADIEQKGCGNREFCYEPNAHLDNAVAVLSGGPYGIGDGAGYSNRTLIMYSCRPDGLLLRPRWPLTKLDFAFVEGPQVWAAHDDHGGGFRWSYIVGVNINQAVAITPSKLLQGNKCCPLCDDPTRMVAWPVVVGEPVTNVSLFSDSSPLMFPKSMPLNLPYDVPSVAHTHYATAPVLPNGMVILGEVYKWATMSFGRVEALQATRDAVNVDLWGAPSEDIVLAFIVNATESLTIRQVICTFPSSCTATDHHGNSQCRLRLRCDMTRRCTCDTMSTKAE